MRALSLRVGGIFLESGVAIDSSATMIQDVAIAFKAKNFSNAIALGGGETGRGCESKKSIIIAWSVYEIIRPHAGLQ